MGEAKLQQHLLGRGREGREGEGRGGKGRGREERGGEGLRREREGFVSFMFLLTCASF